MKHLVFILLLVYPLCDLSAQEVIDSVASGEATMRSVHRDSTLNRREKIHEYSNIFVRFIKAFDEIDTTYIRPRHYNWQVLMKSTYSGEWFNLANRETDQSVGFSSHSGIKVGPSIGWRWLMLGTTFEVASLGNGTKYTKTEFNASIYSTMIGVDLFYRRTGSDFQLSRMNGFDDKNASEFIGRENNGIRVAITGVNLYYVLNHTRFSLPSAYSQSMKVQRKNAGSWKFGFSITKHAIDFNNDTLTRELDMKYTQSNEYLRRMRYWDFSLSAGYSYNWVFAKNWLLNIDAMPAIGYKRTNSDIWKAYDSESTSGETKLQQQFYQTFLNRGNINFNITGRLALVWNTGHYFGGLSFIFYNFNYRHDNIAAHNTFFICKAYVGLNFMKRKKYRNKE